MIKITIINSNVMDSSYSILLGWRTPKSRGEPASGVHQSVVAESWDSEGAPDFQH
jgi:hypothetical protein